MVFDFVKELGQAIMKEIAPGAKMNTINKEDFKENLLMLIERLNNLQTTLAAFSMQDRQVIANKIYKASNDRNNLACNAYVTIAKGIGRNDLKIAFDSFTYITKHYIGALESIERNTANTFKDKAITVYNAKLSQVAIMGVIEEAETFVDFTVYLIDNISYEICENNGVKELPMPKKYRIQKIQKHMADFIQICKNRMASNASVITAEIDKVSRNLDVQLIDDNNSPNTGFIQFEKYSPVVRNFMQTGARKFVIFRWLGEQWNIIKHSRYLKAKKEKEWMESHVALLKLQLQNVDPNSEEYRKQVKIIAAYDEMIAGIDQKIDAYLNED